MLSTSQKFLRKFGATAAFMGMTSMTAAAFVPVALLVGCSQQQQLIAQQAITDIEAFDTGLTNVLPQLSAIPGINQAALNTIAATVAKINTTLSAISATSSAVSAQSALAQVLAPNGYLATIVGLLPMLGVTLPPQVSAIFTAVQVIAPVIEAELNLATSAPSTGAAAPAFSAHAVAQVMTPAQARQILGE